MPAPILSAKLYLPPPRADLVPRPRLLERISGSLTARLTLVSAPAGFGKTTLLSAWLAVCETPAAWLSLDEADSDLARFLAYLIAALQTAAPGVGAAALAALQSPQPQAETVLTLLLNEISTLPGRLLLVLDDYHAIDSPAVDGAVAFLVEHLPPQLRLAISGRQDPHLPLPRLRARGQLTELRAADLRFTPAEAAEFLNRAMGLELSAEDIAALETRTEGWIAGLQLAALSMQGHQHPADFIKSFTGGHHFVLDYLMEEVLGGQPGDVQAFLLRTSILERLCGPLCDALLAEGGGDPAPAAGQETLERLERANLFIVPLDSERRWYRYHQLFGDLLRQRLGRALAPGEIADLHRRASRWYEGHADLAAAFQHALAAGEADRAAGLAEAAWQDMDDAFQTAAWMGWVRKLPDEATRRRPLLNTQAGLALMDAGQPQASERRLQQAERCLEAPPAERIVTDPAQLEPLPAMIALARAYNALVQGDLPATVRYARLALQHIPAGDHFRRAQANIMLEFTHWSSGELDAAGAALEDWMDSMRREGNFTFVIASGFALADLQIEQGRLRAAEETYRQSLQLAAEHGREARQVTAHHLLGLAMLAHERGQDDAAAGHLQQARELGEHTTLVDWAYRWQLAQARLSQSRGDLEAALLQLDEARRVYVKNLVPDVRPVEALKARVHLRQGRLDEARDWARRRGLSASDAIDYLGEFEHLVLARLLIAEAQLHRGRDDRALSEASGLLERLAQAAAAQSQNGVLIEILLVQALARQAQGGLSPALAALERALALAEPEGYVRTFVDEGPPLAQLLTEAAARGMGPGYVAELLRRFRAQDRPPPAAPDLPPAQALIEPLSRRELEILQLVAQGLSNHEIGERLFLAVSTVKGHNRLIFNKLQAQNRTEAVARARELGLL